jgi:hypothetical protein
MNRQGLRGLAAAALALLTACEGGGDAGVSGNGTGGFAAVGRVDGFGSAIVEGERLDDLGATVRIDENPAAPSAAPLTGLSLGSQVSASARGQALERALSGAEVIGFVDEIGPTANDPLWMTVLGQRILLKHPVLQPVIDGFGRGDVRTERVAEVHGLRLSNGDIVATRIEQRNHEQPVLRLAGTVSQLDPVARRFSIGTMVVNYAGASVLPAGAALSNGVRVVVYHARPAVPMRSPVVVQTVRVDASAEVEGEDVRLSGFISSFASSADFRVRQYLVDGSAAQLAAGTVAGDLRNDAFVRVSGRIQEGRLRAQRIQVLRAAADAPISVTGPISELTLEALEIGLRVRGTSVDFDNQTQFVGGSSVNVSNGVQLSIRGRLEEGALLATRAEFVDPPTVVAGVVSDLNGAAGTFRVAPQTRLIRLNAGTVIRGGTVADIANGRRIRIAGNASATAFDAQDVTLLGPDGLPSVVVLAGPATDVSQNPPRFYLNRTQIDYNGATLFTGGATGTAADLAENTMAIVRGTPANGALLASSITVRPTLTDENSILGYASGFVSLSDFRIGGQRINAGAAQIAGGSVRDGAYLLIEGAMTGSTFVAVRVDVLPN